jgi:hypothetical protein
MSGQGWIWRVALAALGAAWFVAVAWVVARRARGGDPEERAFGRLARWLGLGRGARTTVKELAAKQRVAPVALLVCADALKSAMTLHQELVDGAAGEELRRKVLGGA